MPPHSPALAHPPLPLRLPQFSQWSLSAFVCLALLARCIYMSTSTWLWGVRPVVGSDTSRVSFKFLGGAGKRVELWS